MLCQVALLLKELNHIGCETRKQLHGLLLAEVCKNMISLFFLTDKLLEPSPQHTFLICFEMAPCCCLIFEVFCVFQGLLSVTEELHSLSFEACFTLQGLTVDLEVSRDTDGH